MWDIFLMSEMIYDLLIFLWYQIIKWNMRNIWTWATQNNIHRSRKDLKKMKQNKQTKNKPNRKEKQNILNSKVKCGQPVDFIFSSSTNHKTCVFRIVYSDMWMRCVCMDGVLAHVCSEAVELHTSPQPFSEVLLWARRETLRSSTSNIHFTETPKP